MMSIGVLTSPKPKNAVFAIKTYIIQATSGQNGEITPSGNNTVNHGSNITFNFKPNVGYKVKDVKIIKRNNRKDEEKVNMAELKGLED